MSKELEALHLQAEDSLLTKHIENSSGYIGSLWPAVYQIEKEMSQIPVVDDASYASSVDLYVQCADLKDAFDQKRREALSPLRTLIDRFTKQSNGLRDKIESLKEGVKEKIGSFHEKKEKEREASFEHQIEDSMGIALDVAAMGTDVELPCGSARVYFKKKYSFEIDDYSKIPSRYFSIDSEKIEHAISLGVRNIPGVIIKQERAVVIRRNNDRLD